MPLLTDEQRKQIDTGRPFSAWLPIRTRSGVVISEVPADCSVCGRTVKDELSRIHCQRPIPGVHVLTGYVCCLPCKTAPRAVPNHARWPGRGAAPEHRPLVLLDANPPATEPLEPGRVGPTPAPSAALNRPFLRDQTLR